MTCGMQMEIWFSIGQTDWLIDWEWQSSNSNRMIEFKQNMSKKCLYSSTIHCYNKTETMRSQSFFFIFISEFIFFQTRAIMIFDFH